MNATVTSYPFCGTAAGKKSYVEFYYNCTPSCFDMCAILCTTAWAFALI